MNGFRYFDCETGQEVFRFIRPTPGWRWRMCRWFGHRWQRCGPQHPELQQTCTRCRETWAYR